MSCDRLSEYDRESVLQALADSSDHTSETWGVTLELLEDGSRFISISSPYARTNESRSESTTILYGPVQIEIRDSSGTAETRVWADRALYLSRVSEFYLEGNVQVATSGNRRLFADDLTWYQFRRSVETQNRVTMVTETDSITGIRLDGDDRLISYEIKRVSGTFALETPDD